MLFGGFGAGRIALPELVPLFDESLAHSIGSEVEKAYRRSDLFQKRRKLMEAWDRYCAQPGSADVVMTFKQRRRAS